MIAYSTAHSIFYELRSEITWQTPMVAERAEATLMGETPVPQRFVKVPNEQDGTCFGGPRPLALAQMPHREVTAAAAAAQL